MQTKKLKKKGFTLVELVVVVAVIAVLSAILIPTIGCFVEQAKETNDMATVRLLNAALIEDGAENAQPRNMTEALDAMARKGYLIDRLTPRSSGEILWDSANNRFLLRNKEDKDVYADNTKAVSEDFKLWKVVKNKAEMTDKYANYLLKDTSFNKQNLSVTYSVDVGENDQILSVSYTGTQTARDVVIRTNSARTTLTIDDESEGSIYHYGSAGALNIIECHTASYHEYGQVAFAEIATGRIVLESGSEMKHIHINANGANGFDTVIIADNGAKAIPEAITRDQVDVSEAKAVVTVVSGSTSETVYVYPYTDAQEAKIGTTEQTETQNTSIASALGKLVLDNGNGSKALSEATKTETKTELVNEAKAPEIAEEVEEDETAVIYNLTTGAYYDNLYSAIEAVPENTKTTLILLKNVSGVSNENYKIAVGQNIVFDLNGHTFNTVAPKGNTAYAIENLGNLTIKDNTDKNKDGTGKGKLELNALDADTLGIPGYASNVITNRGTLVIESGWIHNASSHGSAAFAIDNDSRATGTDNELVINGGRITSNKSSSIRQVVLTNTTSNVVINGGVIGSYWIQNYGTENKTANGRLVINDVEALYNFNFDLGYSIDRGYDLIGSNVIVEINGGNFKGLSVRANDTSVTNFLNGGTFSAKVKLNGDGVHYTINGGTFNDDIISEGTVTRNGGTYNALVRENYATLSVWFGDGYITDAIVGEDYTIDTGYDLSGKVVSAKYYGDNPAEVIDSSKITIDGSKITIDKTALHKFTGKQFCIWIKVSDAE